MAGEQQIVLGLHAEGEAHEEAWVEEEHQGHAAGDLLRGLIRVEDTGADEAPVGNGAPEVAGFRADGGVQDSDELRCHVKIILY